MVSNTVIDWFFPWPESALLAVARHFMASADFPEVYKEAIVQHMVHVHTSVNRYSQEFELELRRVNHVTPTNYLDFINTYHRQYELKKNENHTKYKVRKKIIIIHEQIFFVFVSFVFGNEKLFFRYLKKLNEQTN